MKAAGLKPTENTFQFLKSALDSDGSGEISRFVELEKEKILRQLNDALVVHAAAGNIKEAKDSFEQLLQYKPKSIPQALEVLVSTMSKTADPLEIHQLFKRVKSCGIKITTQIYNCLLECLSNNERWSELIDRYQHMQKAKALTPNRETFHIILSACAKRKNVQSMYKRLQEMRLAGIQPNKDTFQIFASLFVAADDVETAVRFFAMSVKGKSELELAINTYISSLSHTATSITTALKQLQKGGIELTISNWNHAIKRYASQHRTSEMAKFFGTMKETGVRPSSDTYRILAIEFTRANELESLQTLVNESQKGSDRFSQAEFDLLVKLSQELSSTPLNPEESS
jgi:pentatricopeptide repeat protein